MDANDPRRMPAARAAPALRCQVTVSKRFLVAATAAHLGALAVAIVLALSEIAYAGLCLAVAASWAWTLRRDVLLRTGNACVSVELSGERTCALRLRNGRELRGEIASSSRALPWLIVLAVMPEGRSFAKRVVLFPDSLPPDVHRRLRARLRWMNPGPAESDRAGGSL